MNKIFILFLYLQAHAHLGACGDAWFYDSGRPATQSERSEVFWQQIGDENDRRPQPGPGASPVARPSQQEVQGVDAAVLAAAQTAIQRHGGPSQAGAVSPSILNRTFSFENAPSN